MKLAHVCDNCIHWDGPPPAKLSGMKRKPRKGFCMAFNFETGPEQGKDCPSFECWATDLEKMSDLQRQEPND